MTRTISQRIKVKGKLITQTPLHVGGMSLDPTIDLALAVDGCGRYYIPGTSWAGALRHWCDRHLGTTITNSLWGYQEQNKGHASFITIEDTYFDTVQVELRDGVGIDRNWGSAADRSKFDRAIIPKGVSCKFRLSVDISPNSTFEDNLNSLLDALCAGEIRLGASKTRGLGRVKLVDCQQLTQTLNTKEGILEVLRGKLDPQSVTYQAYQPQTPLSVPQLQIRIEWKPVGAMMVKDAIAGNAVDMLPLTSADGVNLALVIPGSSIKGALRSQAERIVRTVTNYSHRDDFLEQVKVPIVEELFGAAAKKDEQKLGQGALFIDDCYSQKKTDRHAWQQVIQSSTEQGLIAALSNANLADTQSAVHVAIDRWTGGAAEQMLYSNLEPFKINWSEIELMVNLDRLTNTDRLPAIALLLLLLRDLYHQKIPFGYGVNRGMGAIEVTKIQISGKDLDSDRLAGLSNFELSINRDGSFQGINSNLLNNIDTAWKEAIARINLPPEAEDSPPNDSADIRSA